METDLNRYTRAMIAGHIDTCAEIEKRHDLYGYPPELVTVGLEAIAKGKEPHEAINQYCNGGSNA
ncbi:hypothetical protein CAL26_09820 [Bordetella genomosp. 9]|uniref:Uncharacterized protein n=1 Tax=Bordetella genomosp. 9 TaxID=1416803 RepID=A0A261RFB6_9BORD|nr:hypothetical protein [Bordetella genomosp. 9]OZI23719.1 hypothetical protein CAL26_09820 [Bordetella genomosp. 9]